MGSGEMLGSSLRPIRKQKRRARDGVPWLTFRVLLSAGAVAAWLIAAPAHASSISPSTSPVNLLPGDDATFSTSAGTWSNYSNASVQWAPSAGEGASGGLTVAATGPDMAVVSGTSTNGGLTPAISGAVYSAGISADAPSGSQLIQPALIFYRSDGTVISTVFGSGTKVESQWVDSGLVVAIAPTGTASVALAIVVYNSAAGSSLILDNAWIEQTAEANSPPVVGPLTTSGNKIFQANGTQLVPRGVVLNGLEDSATASTVTQHAVVEAKEWGANIVRVPLGEQFWLSSNCDYAPGYQAEVSQVVNWITSLGMVALLDLHTNTVLACQAGHQHNMADAAQSPTFWSQVASTYASNPLVAFDLYNEPHDISNQVWLNGGMTVDSAFPFTVYQAAGMQQLYNAVRGTGAQNLVFASGLDWANTPPSQLISGNNIVYAVHVYTCPHEAPPSCAYPNPYDPSTMLRPWISFAASQPVAITEFGWPSQTDGTYAANMITDARAQGWGWIAFAWEDAHNPTGWDITERWSPTTPAEPAPSGIPIICEFIRASGGASPCTTPSITSSAVPTSQMTPPPASTGPSYPTNEPAGTGSPAGPPTITALGTRVPAPNLGFRPASSNPGVLGANPVTGSRALCIPACDTTNSPVGAGFSSQTALGHSGQSGTFGSGSIARAVRLAAVPLALGTLLVPPLIRRRGKRALKSA